ncbi:MAG: undecaprenyl-diphosphate phosphatase [Lachnospiraceae bacterium]|nr:undecaprenyl-diphosphate phosphatase [Lachnospiraceae bacterium]
MAEILKAILFGIVEGITEWLPVSSTGHMILLDEFVKLNVTPEFWEMFKVVIQLGAILAVIQLYWNTIWPLKRMKVRGGGTKIVWKKQTLLLWVKVIIACIPAAIVGIAFDDWLEAHLQNFIVVAVMLILVGIAFIVVENMQAGKTPTVTRLKDISYKDAIIIGVFQLIAAILPGTSRSGATIIGSLLLGISRPVATKFTFILAIPVMAGASLLKILKHGLAFSGQELGILAVGMIVAFVVSMVVIRMMVNYIRTHDFKVFGWYRIILGLLVLLYFGLLK